MFSIIVKTLESHRVTQVWRVPIKTGTCIRIIYEVRPSVGIFRGVLPNTQDVINLALIKDYILVILSEDDCPFEVSEK